MLYRAKRKNWGISRIHLIVLALGLVWPLHFSYADPYTLDPNYTDYSPITFQIVNQTGVDLPYSYYFDDPCDSNVPFMGYALNSTSSIGNNKTKTAPAGRYDIANNDVVMQQKLAGVSTLNNGATKMISALWHLNVIQDGYHGLNSGPKCVVGYFSIGGYLLGATVDTNAVLQRSETAATGVYSPGMPANVTKDNNIDPNVLPAKIFQNSSFMIIGGSKDNSLVKNICNGKNCGQWSDARYVYVTPSRANSSLAEFGSRGIHFEAIDPFVLGNAPVGSGAVPVILSINVSRTGGGSGDLDTQDVDCPDGHVFLCPGVMVTFYLKLLSSNQGPTSANTGT